MVIWFLCLSTMALYPACCERNPVGLSSRRQIPHFYGLRVPRSSMASNEVFSGDPSTLADAITMAFAAATAIGLGRRARMAAVGLTGG